MIRIADERDISFIHTLEIASFDAHIRLSKRDIRYSLNSPHQLVFVLEDNDRKQGYMIVIEYKRSIRLYSIVVAPESQGNGYGKQLMERLLQIGLDKKKHLSLEVDANKPKLVAFYQTYGFVITKTLDDYYGEGRPGLKMRKTYRHTVYHTIVVEKPIPMLEHIPYTQVVYAYEYMNNPAFHDEQQKIINLCESYKYQSLGYYVSLLAVARNQIVTPSITTIKDLTDKILVRSVAEEIDDLIQSTLAHIKVSTFSMQVYFGFTKQSRYTKLAQELFSLFDLPFFDISFVKHEHWSVQSLRSIHPSDISTRLYDRLHVWFGSYINRHYPQDKLFKSYEYDLAILVNPKDTLAPSDEVALRRFKQAAEQIGFFVEFIEQRDYRRLTEFDALFIRETTNVNDHTYDFSRYAYAEGLIVIDDPWSILKCSNKVFLYELMNKYDIPIPATHIITKNNLFDRTFQDIAYPIIMKQPDSAFSLGVFKVKDHKEFVKQAKALLKQSDMILIQEYVETSFDWRVGVLNNEALYACKYHMIQNDFKIFSIDAEGHEIESVYEGIDLTDVPKAVVELAVRSASLIGDGLYGVDIKQQGDRLYVIEINDNPSIDSGIEDHILGDQLYRRIMQELYDRIESERYQKRLIR